MKLAYFFFSALLLSSCSIDDEPTEDGAKNDSRDLKNKESTFIYNTIPKDPDAEISGAYSTAINGFAVELLGELYAQLELSGQNLIMSPLSVSRVLALIAEGTVNESRDELIDILGGLPVLDDAKSALQEILYADHSVIFQSSDALFVNESVCSINLDFRDLVVGKYGVDIRAEDFRDTEDVVTHINTWASENTLGEITNIIRSDQIDPSTLACILNAIYFKADWESPFDISKTKPGAFHAPQGTIATDMMTSNSYHEITETDYYENFRIYYGTEKKQYFYMDIYMPTGITIDEFIRYHAEDALRQTREYDFCELTMPKFKFESTLDLKPALRRMGINGIFDTTDVSQICKSPGYVSEIYQKAIIETDEEGTKVVAVTVAIVVPSGEQRAIIDNPFVYFIRAGKTGLVLFAGVVNNPSLPGMID